jgi:uncharacterized protein (TIGR02996 family)
MSGALEQAFLSDIVANIDDDTPRLVYADWLMENGKDDRAEFIRVQIERSRLPSWDAAQVRLRLREEELLKLHGEEWLAELPEIDGAKWEGFRRGIVAEVRFMDFDAMRKQAHACRAVAPVEAITVRWPRKREKTRKDPKIAELRELSLTGRSYSEEEIEWLADSPQLGTLNSLTARGLWPEGLEALVASPHLVELNTLRLPANNLGNEGIMALTRAASMRALEVLDLSGRGVAERYTTDPIIQVPGMESLANWPGLASVRSLNLIFNEIGAVGLRTLLRSPFAVSLEQLSLRGGRLDGNAMAEFGETVADLELHVLNVGDNVFGELGLQNLASARSLRNLKVLHLDRCEIPLSAGRVWPKAQFLADLRILDLSHNLLGAAGVTALIEANPPMLHTLNLRDNDLFDKAITALAASSLGQQLQELDLGRNGLSATETEAFCSSEEMTELRVLRLDDNNFSNDMLKILTDSPLAQRVSVFGLGEAPKEQHLDPEFFEYGDGDQNLGESDYEIPF